MNVTALKAGFEISQPAISQHLAVLRRAGLVSERRDGRSVNYRVDPKGLAPLVDWMGQFSPGGQLATRNFSPIFYNFRAPGGTPGNPSKTQKNKK